MAWSGCLCSAVLAWRPPGQECRTEGPRHLPSVQLEAHLVSLCGRLWSSDFAPDSCLATRTLTRAF